MLIKTKKNGQDIAVPGCFIYLRPIDRKAFDMKRLLFIISILLPMTIAAQDATFRDMRRDTSTRGVDFSVKLIGSPGGDVNLVGGSDYIRGALGGEVTLGYRVNKAFTAGIGFDYVNAWNKADYGTGFTSAFIYMKVNFKEKPKFTPYVSLNFGYDVLSTIADGLSDRGDIYVDDPCGTAFVEARFDYGVSYQYLPSVAVGYTF